MTMGGAKRLVRLIIPAAAALALAACGAEPLPTPLATPSPDGYPVHGIDISKYQGDINWRQVRSAGVKFAFIKATEGGDRFDERFTQNWKGAAKAGIPRGAYHFYYFCRKASEQARWFIRHVPKDPNALPPVLDMEWNGHSPTCPKKKPRAKVLSEMRIFLDKVERHYGRRAIIYTSVDFHREVLRGEFKQNAFWLRSVAAHPRETYPDRPWLFWQFTGTGTVKGIKGEVDRNVYAGNGNDWSRWLKALRPER